MEEKVVEVEETEVKQTKKQLLLEIIRFLLVGGSATLIEFIIAYIIKAVCPEILLGSWSFTGAMATTVGFTISLVFNYFLNLIFVFKDKKNKDSGKSMKDFGVFVLISVVVLVFQLVFMFLCNDLLFVKVLNWNTLIIDSLNLTWGWCIAKVFATCVGLVVNYIGRKLFIFK